MRVSALAMRVATLRNAGPSGSSDNEQLNSTLPAAVMVMLTPATPNDKADIVPSNVNDVVVFVTTVKPLTVGNTSLPGASI